MEASELASLGLLSACSHTGIEELATLLRPRRLEAGEVLMREGETGDTFVLVLDGCLAVIRRGDDGDRAARLADGGPGSIFGELALLRCRPRTATVVAEVPSLVAVGGVSALHLLMDLPGVQGQLRQLASSRLARDARPVQTSLPDGTPLWLRPLLAEDRERFADAVRHLSPQSRRQRFFSPGTPSESLIDYLLDIDYVDHFAWLALARPTSGGEPRGIGAGRYVRGPGDATAEVAFGVVDALQGRGVGTALTGAVAVAALEAGITTLIANVLEGNSAMRTVLAKAGGSSIYSEPGVLRVEISAERATQLLDGALRVGLASAVHDIVTAASLALAGTPPL